jgi:hypothetical protein
MFPPSWQSTSLISLSSSPVVVWKKEFWLTAFLSLCIFYFLLILKVENDDPWRLNELSKGRFNPQKTQKGDEFFIKFILGNEEKWDQTDTPEEEKSKLMKWVDFEDELIPGYPETKFPPYTKLSADSRQLFYEIIKHQFPESCAEAPKLLVPDWTFGFGSAVHVQSYTFEVAHAVNRTWIAVDTEEWKHFKHSRKDPYCQAENTFGFECYFEPITSCIPRALGFTLHTIPWYERVERSDISRLTDPLDKNVWAVRWNDWMPQGSAFHERPEKYRKVRSQLWYQSQIVAYLFRLKPHVLNQCEALMSKINFRKKSGGPIVGMHIRHGDKFLETFPHPFSQYMELLKAKWPHVKRVFLASDDKFVFFESFLSDKYKKDGYEFLYVMDETFYKSDWENFRSLLCDIYILSECDYFVGTMSSNLGRLVWELMYSKKPGAQVLSLDSPWWNTP